MYTFGHGQLDHDDLAKLVAGAGITGIVDVRRFPGSRHNEAAARGEVERLADEIGIAYRHDVRLGGRRSLSKEEDLASPDTWWEVKAFRAYARWTRADEFRAGLADLLAQVAAEPATAIMCSEAVWWRCHRRVIADVAALEHGVEVNHLMHSGHFHQHEPSKGARLVAGQVVWDGHPQG
jgi:uncharacterized protein (DUF488 family)